MSQHTWKILSGDQVVSDIRELERLLYTQRELTEENQTAFLTPQYDRDIFSPYLMSDMQKAVDRIYDVIEKGETIVIYGDYDADGVSSTAIMVSVLQMLGAHVVPYLPHRIAEGYGLSQAVLERLHTDIGLLITVDCGISNFKEIEWMQQQGTDVIVVDHHEIPKELPPAFAILHPRHPEKAYPWPNLCGAGVSFKLAQGLLRSDRSSVDNKNFMTEKWLLDLPLIGTVADVMPLLGENRTLVQFGLEVLKRTRRLGLSALLDVAGLSRSSLTVEDVSFRIIPLINAAGRVDHPQIALDVLLASDEKEAQKKAQELILINKERQSITRRIAKEAERHINPKSPIAFAADATWPAGIVGLVAGQMAKKFHRPAFVLGGNGRHAVGSGRSIMGMNILEGLRSAESHALKLGGHAGAVGFSVELDKIADFREALEAYFISITSEEDTPQADVHADIWVDHSLLTWETFELIQKFEPFGEANRKPRLYVEAVPLLRSFKIGKEGQHMRYIFLLGEQEVEGIGFGLGEQEIASKETDIICTLERNEFRGRVRLQLRIEALSPSEVVAVTEEAK